MAIRQYTDEQGRTRFRVNVALNSKRNPGIRFRKTKSNIDSFRRAELEERRLRDEGLSYLTLRELDDAKWSLLVDEWELELRKGKGAKRGVNQQSREDYISLLRNYTKDWFNTPADRITRANVREVLEEIAVKGSHSRMKRLKTAIDGVFNWSIDSNRLKNVPISPAQGITIQKQEEEKLPEILTYKEIREFLRLARQCNHRWFPVWAMAMMTGMRSGELYALTWSDVDFENRRVKVHRSYNKRTRQFKSTKAGYWREIPISDELELFLKELKLQAGSSEFVLPRIGDWERGRGATVLRTFLIGVGLPSIRFHALRACFATQLLRQGIAPITVMKICGWKDLKTMQHYIRLAGIEIEGATDKLKILSEDQVMGRVVDLFIDTK